MKYAVELINEALEEIERGEISLAMISLKGAAAILRLERKKWKTEKQSGKA